MPFLRRSSNDRPAADELRCRATRSCKVLVALGMASLLLGALSPANAAKITERARQKRAVESERIELRQKLADLKRDIDRTETEKGRAADALAHSEAAISEANRLLRELANDQAQTEAKLNQLSKQQTQLANAVDIQQKQLARLLREQYVAGNEDRVKLLLSGDNPNRINRDLQYMGYVSQAQARLLTSLRANLQAVEANRAEMQNAKDELEEIAQEARQQKARLEKEKSGRAALLAQLSAKLASQRKEAGHIERNEQRLAGLVARLSKLIDEQRKAEAAAQAKRRQAQLARAKQERQRAAQARNGAAGKAPRAIEDERRRQKLLREMNSLRKRTSKRGSFRAHSRRCAVSCACRSRASCLPGSAASAATALRGKACSFGLRRVPK